MIGVCVCECFAGQGDFRQPNMNKKQNSKTTTTNQPKTDYSLRNEVVGAHQHAGGDDGALVHHGLLQVALDLGQELGVDDLAQHAHGVGAVQVDLFLFWVCFVCCWLSVRFVCVWGGVERFV